MKTLLLAFLLLPLAANAQTPTAVSDKNIRECFKRSMKMPGDFDRCVAAEFQRVREDKEYRAARIKVGKDPYGGCGKDSAYKECFNEIMQSLEASSAGSDYSYSPSVPSYRYRYYPYRHYLRPYYPVYPRFYLPRTWRRY